MGWLKDKWNSAVSFVKDNASAVVHTALDVAGFIPVVGTVADVANAAIYAAEGDWKNAGLSALSAIPGIGDGIAAVSKSTKVVKAAKTVSKIGKAANEAVGVLGSLKNAAEGDFTGVITDLLFAGKGKIKSKLLDKFRSSRLGKKLLPYLDKANDWLQKAKGKIKTGANKVKEKLKQKLTNLKKRFKSFGKKIKCKLLKNGTCFTGDTLVYTKEGYLPIKNIRAGDDIYSREERTGETGFQKVEEVFLRSVHTIYTIEVNTTTKIQTTSRHPFYVEGEGWVIANQLQVGMNLQTLNGTAVITDLRKERTEEEVSVYNFRVSEWSSYFVSEWNVYVHNANWEYNSNSKYTQTIKWGIHDIQARPEGKGFWGKRVKQKNSRVDNFELKINPNDESYYLPLPDGSYVQFENKVGSTVQDGKLIMSQKSFYHVDDMPSFAKSKVLQEAKRQLSAAANAGYDVEWLVSDKKALTQLKNFFKEQKVNIKLIYYPE